MAFLIMTAIILGGPILESVIWLLFKKPQQEAVSIEDWLDDRYERLGGAVWGQTSPDTA